ncbi:MAG: flagellin N-terminal helical domain-containing protein [Planctomycetota bacterium]|jgi:flagellar hook-associated protein 3 FlgL
MSTIPSNLARVPNALLARIVTGTLGHTNRALLQTQIQLATGKIVNRPSDDAIAASTISVLDDVLERRDQRLRNLSHAESALFNVDAALGDASELVLEAKGIASSQIGAGSDAETRANQALVIDSLLNEMVDIANRQFQDIYFFGGTATANRPIDELLGGLRYNGTGDGLETDLGLPRALAITMSGSEAFGALSVRVEGEHDLDPTMTGSTLLSDLNGARGRDIALGSVNVDVGGTNVTVDLAGAHTVQDVIDTLEAAIQVIDPAASVGVDGVTGNRLEITGNTVPITISDLSSPATAADLGLDTTFAIGGGTGSDLDPALTELTNVSALSGVTVPLGTIRLTNMGQSRELDLSGAQTVQDVMNLVKGLDLGIRVEIAESGDRLNFINELSGGQMSIAEVGGGTTATELGVRSFTGSTRLADFNNGRGVQIRSGSVDPVTGAPDPASDLDFRITLKDGSTIDVDLAGAETVQDVIDMIRSARDGLGILPAQFDVDIAADGNGFTFTDGTAPPGGTFSIEALNGSFAASDLGILGSTTGASMTGTDRATVAVDSVFTHLIALRDALQGNDTAGITLAAEKLEDDVSRLARSRAGVGVRSQRVANAAVREDELRIQDISLRSQVQDLDYTEAAIRFSVLQQQLQAGLATASRVTSLSLLDFLG